MYIPGFLAAVVLLSVVAIYADWAVLSAAARLFPIIVFGGLLLGTGDRLKVRLSNGQTRDEQMTSDDIVRILSEFES